jgi:hypothetical protein
MKQRKLGRGGPIVSAIGLGCETSGRNRREKKCTPNAISAGVGSLDPLTIQFVLPRRGTMAFAVIVWTISPCWFVVTLRNRMMP